MHAGAWSSMPVTSGLVAPDDIDTMPAATVPAWPWCRRHVDGLAAERGAEDRLHAHRSEARPLFSAKLSLP
jgi:hypothetical protein